MALTTRARRAKFYTITNDYFKTETGSVSIPTLSRFRA